MTIPPVAALWVLGGVAFAWLFSLALRRIAEAKRRAELEASWGEPIKRTRDMNAVASYHLAAPLRVAEGDLLDDRTWADLDLDRLFETLDRTQSTVGQQLLYDRLRGGAPRESNAAFEAIVEQAGTDAAMRLSAQLALSRLTDRAGYNLWSLATPDLLPVQPWFAIFPVITCGLLGCLLSAIVWPPALLISVFLSIVSWFVRSAVTLIPAAIQPVRQLGPLIAAATDIERLSLEGAAPIVGRLPSLVPALRRLQRLTSWIGRELSASPDLGSIVIEYLNTLLMLDATALYFAGRELRARAPDLLALITVVGEVDGAIAIASYRAGTAGWTRPVPRPPGSRIDMADVRHPLVPDAVPNSVSIQPPRGLIITGSNMSGKSTFLRTVGSAVVMAQTINTCLASEYSAPFLRVRSCIGRSDDLSAGKSYYLVEVESVLDLVRASQAPEAHLFLFDELFRGTNAVERVAAGEAVLMELLSGAVPHLVIAATHDQELIDLLDERYIACHFTDRLGQDGLTFEYRLVPGPATSRNAIALLRLNGAPEALVDRAMRRAAALDERRAAAISSLR